MLEVCCWGLLHGLGRVRLCAMRRRHLFHSFWWGNRVHVHGMPSWLLLPYRLILPAGVPGGVVLFLPLHAIWLLERILLSQWLDRTV